MGDKWQTFDSSGLERAALVCKIVIFKGLTRDKLKSTCIISSGFIN